VNFLNVIYWLPLFASAYIFLCADQRSRESGADRRIKNQKTTRRYEFISCNPYHPSG
jgi:hypothetical protein